MKRLLTVTFFTGILTLFKMIAGFIVAKAVAIYTGPVGIVLLGQIQSIVAGLNGVVNAPGGAGVVRYTAENINHGPEKCAPWWRASIRWVIIILGIVMPLTILSSKYMASALLGDTKYTWVIIITGLMLPFSAFGTFISSIINGAQNYKAYVFIGLFSTVLSTIVMVLFVYFNGVNGALLAVAIQNSIIGLIMMAFIFKQHWFKWGYIWGACESERMGDIKNYILMAVTSALVVPLSLIFVRKIIIHFVGWDEAGYWQAIWKISETYLMVVTIALGTYFLPQLAMIKNPKAVFREINKTLIIVLPIVALCSLTIYLARSEIIAILFSRDFLLAQELMPVQLVGDILKISSWLYAYIMISKGMTKIFIFSEVFFACSFTLLVYFFVKHYGVIGAPIAYVVNYLIYFIFSFSLVLNFSFKK